MAKTKKKGKLTPKQSAFVTEYIKDFNGTQAAIRAGYAASSARTQAKRLLTNDYIQAEISSIQANDRNDAVMSYKEACEILTRKGRACIGDYYDDNGKLDLNLIKTVNPEAVQGLETIEKFDREGDKLGDIVKVKISNGNQAIELLAKLKGWNAPEEHKHSVVFRDECHDGI